MHPYVVEQFSDEEQVVLRRYFTNLEGPVFALVNLPDVVKGALFARYSRWAWTAPTSCIRRSSSSTVTTPWLNSGECTWPVNRRAIS